MWTLIKCEYLRFHKWALGLAVLHLFVLANLYLGGAQPSDPAIANGGAILYGLLGLSFGLLQISGYRRPSQWTFLIHRPLPPTHIWLALTSAAALSILLVVIVPLYLVLLSTDLNNAQYLDLRTYLLPVFVCGLAFCGYLCGTFILLSSTRAALVVLALPAVFLTREAGLWIFIPQLAIIGLLLWLNCCAFQPDRQAHPKSITALLPTAFAIQWGLYSALYICISLGYQLGLMATRQHPNYNPAPDTPRAISAMSDAAAVSYGFGDHASPMLRQELAISEVHRAFPQWSHFPFRQQLPFADSANTLFDDERQIQWQFSHDQKLFKGVNIRNGADAGWMGRSGAVFATTSAAGNDEHFREIPRILDHTMLVVSREIYQVNFDNQKLSVRHQLKDGEHYRSGIQLDGKMAVAASDRHLYFFDAFDVQHGHNLLQPDAIVPLPRTDIQFQWVYVAELTDGFALTFVFGNYGREGWDPASPVHLVSGLLPLGGKFAIASERQLNPTYRIWFSYKEYLISPLYSYLNKAVRSAIEPHAEDSISLPALLSRSLPGKISVAMLISTLLCALATTLLSRHTPLSARARTAWIIASAATGWPGVLSYALLTGSRKTLEYERRFAGNSGEVQAA